MIVINRSLDETLINHIRLIESMKGRDYWLADKERLFIIEMIKCIAMGYKPIENATKTHMRNVGFMGSLFNTYKKILLSKQWLTNNGYVTHMGRVCTDVSLADFATAGFPCDENKRLILPEYIEYNYRVNVVE